MGAWGRKKTENQVMLVVICVAVAGEMENGRSKRRMRVGISIVVFGLGWYESLCGAVKEEVNKPPCGCESCESLFENKTLNFSNKINPVTRNPNLTFRTLHIQFPPSMRSDSQSGVLPSSRPPTPPTPFAS
jgi:hypothetical protein